MSALGLFAGHVEGMSEDTACQVAVSFDLFAAQKWALIRYCDYQVGNMLWISWLVSI